MRENFQELQDPRQRAQVRHELYDIIAMTIAAVTGNCDGWDEIEDFCQSREPWLREHLGLKLEHGIPSADTLARVWGRIDPEAFKRCFHEWIKQVHEKTAGEIISIDGKTVCGSKSRTQKPIHMISAWVSEQQMVLGQKCVPEKTNEITTVPLLLEMLDIHGCIVTADAMSCQKEIAKRIVKGKGDYVLSLKENQPLLYDYTKTYFTDVMKNRSLYPEVITHETHDKGHGRMEKRTYYLSSDLSGLESISEWAGLSSIGMVQSHIQDGERTFSETRYAITSLKDIEAFSRAWRTHWSIENGLHYCLDISFNEDHSRIRKDHAPDNLTVLRHFALSALKQLTSPKNASMKRKRKLCAYNLDFLASAVDLILL